MAKNQLPSVDGAKSAVNSIRMDVALSEEIAMETAAIGVAATEGYVPRRVDVKLTRAQAVILRDKLRHLQDSGAKTADGRFVANRTQAVQWILENQVK